jgi:hypothetical protein
MPKPLWTALVDAKSATDANAVDDGTVCRTPNWRRDDRSAMYNGCTVWTGTAGPHDASSADDGARLRRSESRRTD